MATTFVKDPDAELDYGFNWGRYWLSFVADTLLTSEWAISPVEDGGLTNELDTLSATTTTIWLSGGNVGVVYTVTNRITTAGGRTDDRSFMVRVQER